MSVDFTMRVDECRITVDLQPPFLEKYNPDQERDEHGRWTAGGGSAVDLYHGTAAAYVESIKQNGLVVHKENRGRLQRDQALHRGERGQSVYVTPNAKDAQLYGQAAASAAYWKQPPEERERGKERYLFGDKRYPLGGNPVVEVAVLHFRVPGNVAANFKPDKYDNLGSKQKDRLKLPRPRGGLLAGTKVDAKYLVGYTVIRKEEYDKPLSVIQHVVKDGNSDLFAVTTCVRVLALKLLLAKVAKRGQSLRPPSQHRPACRIAQKKLKRAITSFFAGVRPRITQQVVAALIQAGVRKTDSEDLGRIDSVMGGIDFTVFNQLPKATRSVLEHLYADSAKEALRTVMVAVDAAKGPEVSADAWTQVDDGAVEYAQARSAEMVGMRYDKETGKLSENPDAKWAITGETRDGIRSLVTQTVKGEISVLDLPDRLRDAYAFSAGRAEMIARTEMRMADGQGALGGLIAAGNVGQKVWITQEDDLVSDECQENADEGPIDLLDDFPSGDQTEPAHPNCRCTVTGHVDWGTEEEE